MYHILVVDDEPLMRTWLSKSIPKYSSHFDVPHTARDGIEAIEYLKRASYDIVITDIKMPGMDGLSLAKYIQENHPHIVVIIISGFDDFSYARKAIQYGVKDYLLKPLVDTDLIKLLEDISARIEKHSPSLLVKPTAAELDCPRSMLFRAILEDDSEGIYNGYKVFFGTNTSPMENFACVLQCSLLPIARENTVLPTESHSSDYQLYITVENLCKKYNWTAFLGNNGDSYIIAENSNKAALMDEIHQFYVDLSSCPIKTFNMFAGRVVEDCMDLSYSLLSITDLRPLPLFAPRAVYSYAQIDNNPNLYAEFDKSSKKILSDFARSDRVELNKDIIALCQLISKKNSASLWEAGYYLIQSVTDCFLVKDELLRAAWQTLIDSCNSFAENIAESEYATALFQTITSLMEKVTDEVHNSAPVITMAKEYITKHYCESISLSDVASHCNVNSSYLSNLFHKQLGVSYSKFLMQIRMERAAQYLKESPETKVYEVGEKLGFVSTKHFISVFKKYYGVSPTVYQKGTSNSSSSAQI